MIVVIVMHPIIELFQVGQVVHVIVMLIFIKMGLPFANLAIIPVRHVKTGVGQVV